MNELTAQMMLMKIVGDEIWSIEQCKQERVPENWIVELQDTFESGFDTDRNSIYVDNRLTNQYHGILDLHLAYKLAEFLGVDWQTATASALGRRAEVEAIQQAFEEM